MVADAGQVNSGNTCQMSEVIWSDTYSKLHEFALSVDVNAGSSPLARQPL